MWESLIPMGMNLVTNLTQQNSQNKLASQQMKMNTLQSFLSPPRPVPQVKPPTPRLSVPNYAKPVNQKFATARPQSRDISLPPAPGSNNTMLIIAGIGIVALVFMNKKK